jgi:hypothetical protein
MPKDWLRQTGTKDGFVVRVYDAEDGFFARAWFEGWPFGHGCADTQLGAVRRALKMARAERKKEED